MKEPTVFFRLFGETPDSPTDSDLVDPAQMERPSRFPAGSLLNCEYRIKLPSELNISAVETSVLWLTHGKGDEDIGVHFFDRRENKMVHPEVLRQTHKFSTLLPRSPLSYDGEIVKVAWLVRVRIFMADGNQVTRDCVFQLGDVSLQHLRGLQVDGDHGSTENETNPTE